MKRSVYRTAAADGTTRTDAAPTAPTRPDVSKMTPGEIRAAVEVELARRQPDFRADAAMTADALIDRLCESIGYPPPDAGRSVYYRGQYALTSASYRPARADVQDRRDVVVDREAEAIENMRRDSRLAALNPEDREQAEADYQRRAARRRGDK